MSIKKLITGPEYPYQNLSLEDMKGEVWEDIPGLDGYFMVSNYGRIKRSEFEMQYKDGRICIRQEKIIKPMIVKKLHKFIGDHNCFLVASLTLSGKRYHYTVARLVYHCFVKSFDLENRKILILARDCDNFNIKPSNLVASSYQQKIERSIKRKRYWSLFFDLNLSKEIRLKASIANAIRVSKQVSQYTLSGGKIKTFPSAANAERSTGICSNMIRDVANNNGRTAGSFVWRWGKAKKVTVKSLEAIKKERREKNGQKVTKYTLSGQKIAQYPSLQDAYESTGTPVNTIRLILKGVFKSSHGYFWKKGYGEKKIDLSGHKWGKASMAATRTKKVSQYTTGGKYIRTFENAKKAAASIGRSKASIALACRSSRKIFGGYKWDYL